jgi:hypothetical protein
MTNLELFIRFPEAKFNTARQASWAEDGSNAPCVAKTVAMASQAPIIFML